MSKRNLDWNLNKLNKYLKEGRGQGEGKEYKPWLTIQDIPSLGRVTRILGWKTQRVHELFSDIQTRYLYYLEWDDNVIDIRENWPLLDLEEVLENENDLNIDNFKIHNNKAPFILTVTFLATIKEADGSHKYLARSVKASSELEKKSVIDRLEIIRRYFEKKNIDFGIVTEQEIPMIKCRNIEWIHVSYDLNINSDENMNYSKKLIKYFKFHDTLPIRNVLSEFDKKMKQDNGTALSLFKYLIASKQLIVDMDKKIDINMLVKEIIK